MDGGVGLFQIIYKHFNIFIVYFSGFAGYHPYRLPTSDWSGLFHPAEVIGFFQQCMKAAFRNSDEFCQKTNTVADSTAKESTMCLLRDMLTIFPVFFIPPRSLQETGLEPNHGVSMTPEAAAPQQ